MRNLRLSSSFVEGPGLLGFDTVSLAACPDALTVTYSSVTSGNTNTLHCVIPQDTHTGALKEILQGKECSAEN